MTMTKPNNRDPGSLESRVDIIGMFNSDRSAAIGALHRSFVIVERVAWALSKLRQVCVFMFARPLLAK